MSGLPRARLPRWWPGRLLLLPVVLQLATGTPLSSQQRAPGGPSGSRVEGRVLKQGIGQPELEVTLHRVTRDSAGVAATTRSGARGSFSFTLPPADTAAFTVYFTTVDYLGVRYFGPALHPGEAAREYAVEVYDTAAAAGTDGLGVGRRELILLPEEGRGWEVNEILQIRNEEQRTRVPGAGISTWEFRIPPGATDFEVGEGEIAPSDVHRMGDRLFVTAPLPPGTRELFLRYRLPAGERRLDLAVDLPTETLNVYVRQPSPAVQASGLTPAGTVSGEGESFARYSAFNPAPGATVRLEWQAPRSAPLDPRVAAVVLVLLFLSLGAGAALRRREPPTGSVGEEEVDLPASSELAAAGTARPSAS